MADENTIDFSLKIPRFFSFLFLSSTVHKIARQYCKTYLQAINFLFSVTFGGSQWKKKLKNIFMTLFGLQLNEWMNANRTIK